MVAGLSPFEHDTLDRTARALAGAEGIKFGDLVMPARIALTGKKVSPGIWDVMLLLGRDRTVARLRDAADRLESGAAVR
jgi:glutamyl-tRNA synthetase